MAVAKAAYERGKEELKHNKPTVSSYFKGGKQALFNSAVAFFLLALAVRGYSEKVDRTFQEEQMFEVHGRYKKLLSSLENEEWAKAATERLGVKDGAEGLLRELRDLVRRNEMTEKELRDEDLLREHAKEVRQRADQGPGAMKRMLL